MKVCLLCREEKADTEFPAFTRNDNGKRRHHSYCADCHRKQSAIWAVKQRDRVRALIRSGSVTHIAKRILQDCKQNDKKKGMVCDLDLPFVESSIQQPCSYCGETVYRRSLDRIDNNVGHLKSNVTTACVRCNLTRTTMPYEAWLVVARAMREAREAGLFGEWVGIRRCI